MKNRIRFTGVRNFCIIMAVLLLLLFAADRLLPVFSVQANPEDYNNDIGFLRLEKTPVESFLTVAEARKMCRQFQIDISGYSISEYPLIDDMPSSLPAQDDTVNIVVFGDSFVWGDNSLNRNELFWRQTEQMLRAKGYNCRITAVAMASATAYEELEWYKNYLKHESPDLVVFGYVFNDPVPETDEPAGAADAAQEEAEAYPELLPVLKPFGMLFPNLYFSLSTYVYAKTMYTGKYDDITEGFDSEVLKGELREYYQTNFADQLNAITEQTGIPAIVMALPVIPRSTIYREMLRPLSEIYADTAVRFYDPYDAFDRFYSAKHKNNLFVNPGNNHPGSAVHYFYALYLTELLERDFGEVLGEKHSGSLQSRVICVNECTPGDIGLEVISQSENAAQYAFSYPDGKKRSYLFSVIEPYQLTYPLNEGYVKLSFENPVDLSGVELTGAPEGETLLYYTKVNEKLGYDDNTMYPIPLICDGGSVAGTLGDTKVTSICIHIDNETIPVGRLGLTIHS